MMKKIILILTIIMVNVSAYAQTEKKESFFSKGIKSITNYIEKASLQGYDTTYIGLPKHKWLGSIAANFAGIKTSVIGSSLPNYGDVTINLKSSLAGQCAVSLGYRGYALSYSRSVFNGYSSNVTFSLLQKSWGIEYRRHSTDGVHGYLNSSTTGEHINISENDINVRSILLDGYVTLNYKKFIYTGKNIPSLIQKRSAGSILLVGGYINSKITTNESSLIEKIGGIKEIEVTQGVAGIGYGYNYAINNGKILIYGSAMPMAVIHNNNLITLNYTGKLNDGSVYTTEMCKKIETNKKVYFTGIARLSVNYEISDSYVMRLNGILNDIRFKSKDGLSVKTSDWYCDLMFGVRF